MMAVASAPQLGAEVALHLARPMRRLDGANFDPPFVGHGGAVTDRDIVRQKGDVCNVSSSSGPPEIAFEIEPRPQLVTLGWALRRAALGLLILLVMVVLLAWLFYAGIDPDEAAASAPAQNGYAAPQQ